MQPVILNAGRLSLFPRHSLCIKIDSFLPYVLYTESYPGFLELPGCNWPRGMQTNRWIPSFSGSQTGVKQSNLVSNGGLNLIYSRRAKSILILTLFVLPNSASSPQNFLLKFFSAYSIHLLLCSDLKPDSLSSRQWRNGGLNQRGDGYFMTVSPYILWFIVGRRW